MLLFRDFGFCKILHPKYFRIGERAGWQKSRSARCSMLCLCMMGSMTHKTQKKKLATKEPQSPTPPPLDDEAKKKAKAKIEVGRIADRIRADPESYLLDTEDWTRRDAFVRRIRAVKALLLNVLDRMQKERLQLESGTPPANPANILKNLMFEVSGVMWMLEFGIPFYDVETHLQEDDLSVPESDLIDTQAHRAAMLFAEMEKSNNARNWRSKLPNDPEARRRLAQLEFLCAITETTMEEFLAGMSQDLDEEAGVELKNANREEVRSRREKLKGYRTELEDVRDDCNSVMKKLKTADKHLTETVELKTKLQLLQRKRAELLQQKRSVKKELEDYQHINVKDRRTLHKFLRGEENKPAKLKALRDYFVAQLPSDYDWRRPHIDSFFQAVELRWAREGEGRDHIEK